ncbi:hypothetical protein PF005_g2642 [Phytophthora fragariae]|uniref:Uncharacterized protein n=1 Tax=Phytophthora fragariae TaxID=53985 RepID=A0A6A3TGP3_9STRA|nr:hypothetical protein PF003_g21944 [Phytophthora fragariae]KAE8941943.1 hypothetical protein PF009_g8290 [Phytophthora fragariae]KAE9122262.1 hypothetical protein PF010_g6810 [Phytophthora fragariae]KAE9135231.1 hypothetical protein PF007_g2643 [Phytophthora fragariae]KAE9148555.1 hypothetical protein PF006_g6860 [Phytophthora fragariae]
MIGRRTYCRDDRGVSCYSSSSESSLSSESEIESSSGSDVSSDGLDLGLDGKSEAQQKFKRLRRIFLNRPPKAKTNESNQQRRRTLKGRAKPRVERKSSQTGAGERRRSVDRRRGNDFSDASATADARAVDRQSQPLTSVRPLQAAIDQHMNSLWEQMKRHSAQRDSTANQVQSMLEQAVDELQFVKNQEERALESQVRLIRESYALRLEVFQQQYLNKVAEIEDEMYGSIQKRQEECDATILAAAKKLQDQTQHALLKDLAMANNEAIDEQPDSTSVSTGSSSASSAKAQRQQSVRPLDHNPPRSPRRLVSTMKQSSPVSKQRAKLQALEEKLAAFSPESLTRVKNELATPIRRSSDKKAATKHKRAPAPNSSCLSATREVEEWQASPLSPLRKGYSYWKNGVSREAHDGDEGCQAKANRSSNNDQPVEADPSTTKRRRAPTSLLSRRFLRPGEEEELRHLRASIGLAKDWMAKNSQT